MEEFSHLFEGLKNKASAELPPPEKVWPLLVKLIEEKIDVVPFFYEKISNYSQSVSSFITESEKYMSQKMAHFENKETSFEEKLKDAKVFCFIFQYLSTELSVKVIDVIVEMAKQEISETNNIPTKIVSLLDFIEFAAVRPETLSAIYKKATDAKTTEFAFVMAPFVYSIISNVPEAFDEIPVFFENLVQSENEIDKIAGVFIAERVSECQSYPVDIYECVILLLSSKNVKVCQRAHKTIRELVKNGTFETDFILPIVLDQYKEYESSNIRFFFKLVNTIIDSTEELQRQFADIVISIIKGASNSSDDEYKIGFLDLFCTLAARCNSSIGPIAKAAAKIATELLEKRKAVDIIGAYVLAVVKCIPKEINNVLNKFIPELVQLIPADESLKLKAKLNAFESIAVVAKENGKVPKEIITTIADFVLKALDTVSGTQVFYALSPTLELATLVDDEVYKQFYEKIFALLMREAGSNEVNAILSTLVAYTKRRIVAPETVLRTVNAIIDAKIPYLASIKYQPVRNDNTMIYNYLRKACKYYNETTQSVVIPFFVEAVKQCRIFILPSVLEIVKGIVMNDEIGKIIFDSIIAKLPEIKRSDEEAICSCMESLSIVLMNAPASFNADQAIQSVCSIIFSEEEEEDVLDESYGFAAMVRLCFAIFASNVSYTLDKALFVDLLDLLPLDASLEDVMLPIYDSLSDIVKKNEFAFSIPVIAHIIVEPLVLTRDERVEYGVDGPLFDKMRAALKFAVKSKRGLDRELSKGWQRAKINKLSAVLK